MTCGPFSAHAFIPFVPSQLVADFIRFGQHAHDASSVLAKAGSSGGGALSSSSGHTVQYSRYKRGDSDWISPSMVSLKYVSLMLSIYCLRETQSLSLIHI